MSLRYEQNGFSPSRSDKDVVVVDSSRKDEYFNPESDLYDPGRTRQSFAKDADINNIMRKYNKTGILGDPSAPKKPMYFGDFSNVGDFQEHLDMVMDAQDRFDHLSADIRNKFANDPAKLIDFCNDKANYDEAVKLGLLPKPPVSSLERSEEPAPAPKAEEKATATDPAKPVSE